MRNNNRELPVAIRRKQEVTFSGKVNRRLDSDRCHKS